MTTRTLRIRPAETADAVGISDVHDAAWREAYRGIIPGRELEQMVSRRGPVWWRGVLRQGGQAQVIDFEDRIAGYATFGRTRASSLPYRAEIFEFYLAPEFQGLGFGRRLFLSVRRELAGRGLHSTLAWALEPNERALSFYRRLGGKVVARSPERFGAARVERLAFGWGAGTS